MIDDHLVIAVRSARCCR